MPDERFSARFAEDSRLELTPALVGPCTVRLEGIVGEGHNIAPDSLDNMRANRVAWHVSKRLAERYFREADQPPPYHLVGKLQPITRRWIAECLTLKGGTKPGMLTYAEMADKECDLIYAAISRDAEARGEPIIKAMLDPFNAAGSTEHVSFITTKTTLWKTDPGKSHINYVVCDSDWEAEFARVVEAHPATISYVKNQALGFEIPWHDGAIPRRYIPDFIVRIDDGLGPDDPLNLIIEIKGQKDALTQIKAETARTMWVPGVNNLKTFGRWHFEEFSDVFDIEESFAKLLHKLRSKAREREDA